MDIKAQQWAACAAAGHCPNLKAENQVATPCVNGKAGEYPCLGIDLAAFVGIKALGARGDGNDIWGWTDPVSKKEYAIVGLYDGTSFVDVTNPTSPIVLGFLPTKTNPSTWRDIKVFKNYAFIVSEATNHGMQIYDLTLLRNLEVAPFVNIDGSFNEAAPPILKETAWYGQFGSSHNLVINEETGFAYSVGTRTCSGGLHMVDINDPIKPVYAGCFSSDGYTHDAQCVIYKGPDTRFTGREICFNYNEDTLTIVDVTNKGTPVMLARKGYTGAVYTHQGWLFEDHSLLLMNDELDELEGSNPHTRTMLWDVHDLTKPVLKASHYAEDASIDHNLYILGNEAYLTNYCDGLRILDLTNANATGVMPEKAFFDVAPDCNGELEFLGSWSNYPYFPSGTIVVNSIERGLFVLTKSK